MYNAHVLTHMCWEVHDSTATRHKAPVEAKVGVARSKVGVARSEQVDNLLLP